MNGLGRAGPHTKPQAGNGKLLLGWFNMLSDEREREEPWQCHRTTLYTDAIKLSALCCRKSVENYFIFTRCGRSRSLSLATASFGPKMDSVLARCGENIRKWGCLVFFFPWLAKQQVHDHVHVTCLMSDVRWCFHLFFIFLSCMCISILCSSLFHSSIA